jgi:hypothetical protein
MRAVVYDRPRSYAVSDVPTPEPGPGDGGFADFVLVRAEKCFPPSSPLIGLGPLPTLPRSRERKNQM